MKQLFILLVTSFTFWACEEEIAPSQINQEFLLKYEYRNYAWGHQHNGWLLDSAGNIHQFVQPKNWKSVNAYFQIEQDSLKNNADQGSLASFNASKQDLVNIANYAINALQADLSEPNNKGADMGISTISIYQFDSISKVYTEHLIYQWGDWERKRENNAGYLIVDFVNKINTKLE